MTSPSSKIPPKRGETDLLQKCPFCGNFPGSTKEYVRCKCFGSCGYKTFEKWNKAYWVKDLSTARAQGRLEVLGSSEIRDLVDTVEDAISVLKCEFDNTMFNANFGRLKEALAAFDRKFNRGKNEMA